MKSSNRKHRKILILILIFAIAVLKFAPLRISHSHTNRRNTVFELCFQLKKRSLNLMFNFLFPCTWIFLGPFLNSNIVTHVFRTASRCHSDVCGNSITLAQIQDSSACTQRLTTRGDRIKIFTIRFHTVLHSIITSLIEKVLNMFSVDVSSATSITVNCQWKCQKGGEKE